MGPELLYVNASSIADDGTSEAVRPAVAYSDNRTDPIIARSANYRAAIIRFQCTGLDLPVYIPPITPNQPDPNLTTMKIGMRLTWLYPASVAAQIPSFANSNTVKYAYSQTFVSPVYWSPEQQNAPLPPSTIDSDGRRVPQHNFSDYYWARSISHVLENVLQPAIERALSGLKSALGLWLNTSLGFNPASNSVFQDNIVGVQFGALGSGSFILNQGSSQQVQADLNNITAPRFRYADGKISMLVEGKFFNSQLSVLNATYTPRVAWIEILVNTPLRSLLDGFKFKTLTTRQGSVYVNDTRQNIMRLDRQMDGSIQTFMVDGYPFQEIGFADYYNRDPSVYNKTPDCVHLLDLTIGSTFDAVEADAGTGEFESPFFVEIAQEYPSTDSWSPVDCLLFTSTMPIQSEVASNTNRLSGNNVINGGSSNLIIPTFSDIALPLEGGATDYLGKITYSPSAQYRWLEFTTNQALTNINFQLFWRGRLDDKLYPCYLKPNGSVQMKLLLQRKF